MARVLHEQKLSGRATEDRNRVLSEIDKMKFRYQDPEFSSEISALTYQIRNRYPTEEGTSSDVAEKIIGILNVYANSRDNYFKVFSNKDVDLRLECAKQTNTEIFDVVKENIEEVFGDTFVKYSIAPLPEKHKLFKSKEEKEKERLNKEFLAKIKDYSNKVYKVKFALLEEQMEKKKLDNKKIMYGKLLEESDNKALDATNDQEYEKYQDLSENYENEIGRIDRNIIMVSKNIESYQRTLKMLTDLGNSLQNRLKKTSRGLEFSEEEQTQIVSELDQLYMEDKSRYEFEESVYNSSYYYKEVDKEAAKRQQSPTRARLEKLKQERELQRLNGGAINRESERNPLKETNK